MRKLIRSPWVSIGFKKMNTTLYYFNQRLKKVERSKEIPSIQSINAKVSRFSRRLYNIDLSIREHGIYNERINRFYSQLKLNGLIDMDNSQLLKFPFERMKISKAGTISFKSL